VIELQEVLDTTREANGQLLVKPAPRGNAALRVWSSASHQLTQRQVLDFFPANFSDALERPWQVCHRHVDGTPADR
jgi:hypothetical protein